MGFYIRKSLSFGGLRLNLSKSGLGASFGVKGARVGFGPRGNYVHMGMNGLYYRQTLGGRRPAPARSAAPGQPAPVRQPDFQIGPETAIDSGDVSGLVDASSQTLVDEIASRRRRLPLWPLTLLLVFLPPAGLILFPLAALLVRLVIDRRRKTTMLFYHVEAQQEAELRDFYSSIDELLGCEKIWHVTTQAATNKKNSGGAQTGYLIDVIKLKYGQPKHLRTNVLVPEIPAGKQTLYLFPDRILVFEGRKVGGLSYSGLSVTQKATNMVEPGVPPRDATVAGHTWLHVNKSGKPDSRFKDNKQLPVMAYSEVNFTSSTGLNERFIFSRKDAGADLAKRIERMKTTSLWSVVAP
jgi:hypothetical protein